MVNVTETDIVLAEIYYPILVEVATQKNTIEYGELVMRAKADHPNNPYVSHAIPTTAGRALAVVRSFTEELSLPDLSSLVINKAIGDCGQSYQFNGEERRAEVFAFNWSKEPITDFVEKCRKFCQDYPKKEDRLAAIMYRYYKEHEKDLPEVIKTKARGAILDMLDKGMRVEDAFAEAAKDLNKLA